MRVVVDDREREGEVARHLAAVAGVTVEVVRIPLGDYLIDDRLLVERKTVTDLAASICDGRLFRQARRLVAHVLHRVCLVVEGTSRDAERVSVSREAMLGAVISLTLVYGLPVLRSRNPGETAQLLLYAASQLGRVTAGLPRRAVRKLGARERVQMAMLQAIPGIGPWRAHALLTCFGGMGALTSASEREIASVHGFGPTMAARVRWLVSEPARPYAGGLPAIESRGRSEEG